MTPAEKQKVHQNKTGRNLTNTAQAVSQLGQQFASAISTVVSEITAESPVRKTNNDDETWGHDRGTNRDNPNLDRDSLSLTDASPRSPGPDHPCSALLAALDPCVLRLTLHA
jgi:hypothetical protein